MSARDPHPSKPGHLCVEDEYLERLINAAVEKAISEYHEELSTRETAIADAAAARAVQLLKDETYRTVGKALIGKVTWGLGILFLGGLYWAQSKGYIK